MDQVSEANRRRQSDEANIFLSPITVFICPGILWDHDQLNTILSDKLVYELNIQTAHWSSVLSQFLLILLVATCIGKLLLYAHSWKSIVFTVSNAGFDHLPALQPGVITTILVLSFLTSHVFGLVYCRFLLRTFVQISTLLLIPTLIFHIHE